MKELLLFTPSGKTDAALYELGQLGVVDIQAINRPEGDSISWVEKRIAATEKALAVLADVEQREPKKTERKKYNGKDPKRIIDIALNAAEYRRRCLDRISHMRRQLEWYRFWGEQVEVKELEQLRNKGIYLRLYRVDASDLDALPKEGMDVIRFPAREGVVPIVLVARSEAEELNLEEDSVPNLPQQQAGKILVRKKRQLAETDEYLKDLAEDTSLLEDYLASLREQLAFRRALAGMGDIEGAISYLKGFIPVKAANDFKAAAEANQWGYLIREPQNPEEVPVYVKNPRWISIINPVLQFVGVVPGYKEVDISVFFLIAFAVFFAMLIGDAGYGTLFLLLAFLFRKRLPGQLRVLIYVLSGATIFWGVITGTYFGSQQIAGIPFLNGLIIENVSSFGVDNISFMMHLSFVIGAIHLTVAHGIRAVQFINTVKAVSEVGWIALIWGLFFLVEMLVLGEAMPSWAPWLFITGLVLVALFSREHPNFLKSIGLSVANLPLNLINGFSDVVSYVRLFAVGMATAVVAASFNEMILPAGVDRSFLDLLIAAFALALGHGLNIVLALMAVMVHGIRLNMLEFAGHVGIQFSGKEYKPFVLKSRQES